MRALATTATRAFVVVIIWTTLFASAPASAAFEFGKLIALDAAADDAFGHAVVVSGDTMLVGAPADDHGGRTNAGSAYVFTRSGASWTQQATIAATDAANGDLFGFAVALSGDVALVGSPGDDHAGGLLAGSAYVFTRTGSVWSQLAKITAADAASGDRFGRSVAIAGSTAIVGAPDEDSGGSNAGAAYVFTGSQFGPWTQQAKILPLNPDAFDRFGSSVAVNGGTTVVGANHAGAFPGATPIGAAYVFTRTGTAWNQQARLMASDAGSGDSFGSAVAMSGDTVLVGAPSDDHPGKTDAGSGYVFALSAGTWTQQVKLTASDLAAHDALGEAVAILGGRSILGAPAVNDPDGTDGPGSAYVFSQAGGGWTQSAKLRATDASAGDRFGFAVALSADVAIAGAYVDTHAGGERAGSAYIFDLVAPQTQIGTAHESVLLNAGRLGNTVHGTATDDASGVSLVQVLYTGLTPGATTFLIVTASLDCADAERLACSWEAELPPIAGRYLVQAQSRDASGNIGPTAGPIAVTVVGLG